jgi:acetyl esterase/lipase
MFWFWDLYCSPADRTHPRVSPLRGTLAGLPPAFVTTCEFDPLRDEGIAYAEGLAAAGAPVEQLKARGHSFLTMVDVVITGVAGRIRTAEALRRFAGHPPEVTPRDENRPSWRRRRDSTQNCRCAMTRRCGGKSVPAPLTS